MLLKLLQELASTTGSIKKDTGSTPEFSVMFSSIRFKYTKRVSEKEGQSLGNCVNYNFKVIFAVSDLSALQAQELR